MPVYIQYDADNIFHSTWCVDYVQEIYETFLDAHKCHKLEGAAKQLVDMTPAAMNSMLTKQPREEAIRKRDERKTMVVKDVPPTTRGVTIHRTIDASR